MFREIAEHVAIIFVFLIFLTIAMVLWHIGYEERCKEEQYKCKNETSSVIVAENDEEKTVCNCKS